MRYFLLIFAFFFFIVPSFGAIDDNIDYEFINNAFSNPNPTTNKDFENLMEQYENPKEGAFTKLFKFFDSDKLKYDKAFKTKYENKNNQPRRIKDVPDEKPTILITIKSVDYKGNSVPVGYYQVEIRKEAEKYYLDLYQGSKQIATLIARPIEEDEKATSIVYGRAEALENGYIKVIYANLDLTLLGYLKIQGKVNPEFEPIF